jgi:two-component system chemotaxis response regulator CheY
MKRILIIDDSITVRMYHKQILSIDDYEVDEAENGMEALEKVSQNNNYALFDVPFVGGENLLEAVAFGLLGAGRLLDQKGQKAGQD